MVQSIIYQLALGEPRGRLRSNGDVQKKRESWSGVALITSEFALLEDSVVSQGGHARTLTLDSVSWTNDASHSDRIKLGVRENYGFLGQMIADEVLKLGEANLIDFHKEITNQILGKMKYKDALSHRIASKMSPIIISAKILKDLLKSKEIDVNEILEMIVELEQQTVINRAIDDIAYDLILNYINTNPRDFFYELNPMILHHLTEIERKKVDVCTINYHGYIYKSNVDSYVLFGKKKFEEVIKLNGYGTQIKKILKLLDSKGVLVRTEADRLESRSNSKFCDKHYKFMIKELNVDVPKEEKPLQLAAVVSQETPICSSNFRNDEAIEEIFKERNK